MFTVYHSNQIELLKSLLVELIRREPLTNPFQAEQILVQSPGMSQWLKIELAKEFGVAANLEFPLPATFIWQMFTQVLPEVPQRSAFNKEAMTWKLMSLLPTLLDKAEFLPLQRYLADDDDQSKCYQLAEKIADIFDGYLVYRPEWIAAWESGHSVAEIEGEHPWQPLLWQALYDHTVALEQSPYHRANLYQDFIDSLQHYQSQAGESRFSHLPPRLFVFGITSLPPRYMDALKAIGEHIDVHLMFTNPCRYYWGEVRDRRYLAHLAARQRQHLDWHQDHSKLNGQSPQLKPDVDLAELHTDVIGNSLLASMGKLGRDNMYLLSQLESHEIEAFVDIEADNLLHQIQSDILQLQEYQDDHLFTSSQHKAVVDISQRALTVHACHSPMREVEVLHDQLLAMFDANPQLKPRDIIVMVADINQYGPAIQAVFGNAPNERYIPFSISDRSADQESPILQAFMQLLTLADSRCSASELLELLETPAIMAKFDLDDAQFQQAKMWIEEAGIRWGLDTDTATEFDLPASEQNTWLFGIERMLLGYAMPEQAGLFMGSSGDIAAYDEVQGMGAELAGKLAHFVERIQHYRAGLAQTQSVAQWQQWLHAMLADFFSLDVNDEMALNTIHDALAHLSEQLADAGFNQPLSAAIMQQYLANRLSSTRVSQRFLVGQVNFCTLMPMRSIPFHTVCLLGMNEGVYPRSVAPESFDLMVGRTKAGDRSRRDDDRYLFLEALLAAQQQLYISYVGHSIQDNSERMPSILVSELLEYCQQNYCLQGDEALSCDESGLRLIDAICYHHAMVPFSPSAFCQPQQDNPLASYASEWLPVVNQQGQASTPFLQPLPDVMLDTQFPMYLDLAQLQRFWRLPVQYFFNQRLKVTFEPPQAMLADEEPFALDGLQSYQLRDQLLQQLLTHNDERSNQQVMESFIARQRAEGKLPVGAFGELEFNASCAQAESLYEKLTFICSQPLADVEVDIELDGLGTDKLVRLQAWLGQHYQAGLVRYRCGRLRSQDLLAAWIEHLSLAVSCESKATHIVTFDKKEGAQHHVYPAITDKAYARQLLNQLLILFTQGLNQPLAYFPSTALAGLDACIDKSGRWSDNLDQAYDKMGKAFNDGFNFSGEGSNQYIHRVWSEWQPVDESSNSLADQVFLLAQQVLLPARLQLQNAADYYADSNLAN